MIKLHIEGKDVTDALCTLTLCGPHMLAAAETAFIDWLKTRGFQIEQAQKWESPRELAERLHITPSFLSQALKRPHCPTPADQIRGPQKRLIYIRSTASLDEFLTRHLKPKTS